MEFSVKSDTVKRPMEFSNKSDTVIETNGIFF